MAKEAVTEKVFSFKDLSARYQDLTCSVIARCVFATECVGGQPAGPEGIRAFAEHHLGLKGKELDEAVDRITTEEIGERDVNTEGGELKEKLTYGLNVVRGTVGKGPWLGNWMPKACLKAAGSRLGFFVGLRGLKGDMAELGQVNACGISLLEPDHPERIYVIDAVTGKGTATSWNRFAGSVTGPSGRKSIIHDSECLPAGSRFEFEYRFKSTKMTPENIADMYAVAMVIGLGSCKAMERGKFRVETLTYRAPRRDAIPVEVKASKAAKAAIDEELAAAK